MFASSVSVFGITQEKAPPITIDHPVTVTDNYTEHKVKCEEIVKASGLDWVILRFGAVLSFNLDLTSDIFMIPLKNRIEFVDTRDVGTACTNAVTRKGLTGKILLIGGGRDSQFLFGEMLERTLGTMGISMLPEKAFNTESFYTDWIDTAEAQELLEFQNHSFEDYLEEFKRVLGIKGFLARIFSPIAKMVILSKSPYLKK